MTLKNISTLRERARWHHDTAAEFNQRIPHAVGAIVFHRSFARAFYEQAMDVASDMACLICGQNHHNLSCPQTRVT